MQQDHPDQTEWFVSWFQHPLYLKLYQHRDSNEAQTTIETILQHTGLGRGAKVLDIACGAGRHAVELAKHGMEVSANDLSEFLILEAKALAEEANQNLYFSQLDMRRIEFNGIFDMVVQLFTSFGYFKSQAEDQNVLNRVYNALKPEGWYVLDFFNANYVKANLIASSHKTFEDITVTEERKIESGRVTKYINITHDMETLSFTESVMLYQPSTLREMLNKAGFKIVKECGDYHGNEFDPSISPRFMVIAKK